MSEIWNDVFMRDNLNDKGEYPTSGCLSNSPDIIPYGIVPLDDPNKFFVVDNWNKDNLSSALVARMTNYIYARASSLNSQEQTGQLYLYYAKASMLLFPSLWKDNAIKTQGGKDFFEFKVSAGGKFVSFDAQQGTFVWNPQEISNDHYCLIGRIVTSKSPNPIPSCVDVEDFAHFISTHPNYAWHNIDVTSKNSPSYSSMAVAYEQGKKGERLILSCVVRIFR